MRNQKQWLSDLTIPQLLDMKIINIFGDIISTETERMSSDDVSPQSFMTLTNELNDGEDLEIHINSFGGSCSGGIAIANNIKQLIAQGHKCVCYVDGIAASIASVIACACDELKMWKSSMIMIHNCWGFVQGNSEELRKQADTMDLTNKAIVSFYTSKFHMSVEEISKLMDEETWLVGSDIDTNVFDVVILDEEHELRFAASARTRDFKNLPKVLSMENENDENVVDENVKPTEEEVVEENPIEETPTQEEEEEEKKTPEEEEVKEEEVKEDEEVVLNKEEVIAKFKEYEDKIAELSNTPTNEEINKRVSGMQSKMQLQINDLTKDFNDKINALNQELIDARATITNLETERDNAKKELSEVTSSLEAKKQALDSLNSSVLRPNNSVMVYDKESARKHLASLPMSERQKFYDEHKDVIG